MSSDPIITLTGATLRSDDAAGSYKYPDRSHAHEDAHPDGACPSHHHHHHHHHHGNNNHRSELELELANNNINNMDSDSNSHPSIDEVVHSTTEEIVKSVSTLLRFGRFEALVLLLEALVEKLSEQQLRAIFSETDEGGHSVLHWAAKRVDDIRFLSTLVKLIVEYKIWTTSSLLNAASKDNVGMTPLHWACTESSIPHVALLWNSGSDVEARDASGCTPLLIAAQYGQVEVVAYLLQNGANILAVDASRDTALHWAAYKGSVPVCGLLAFYNALSVTTMDSYGQTPLHLAALRGHTSVVRYILVRLSKKEKDILFLKDKNGRSPLDLAIHKNRPNVQLVLKEAMAAAEDPRGHFLRKTMWTQLLEFTSPKAWKQWLGMTAAGIDEPDAPMKAPFYYMVLNFALHCCILFGAFAPVFNAETGLLWDMSGFILLNAVLMVLSWYFFFQTWKTSPGFLDETNPHISTWRRRYEETLEAYAEGLGGDKEKRDALPALCHTCHVARPLRSKHCRVSRKCVLLFDHYCPFVDNTVGLYNYKYFYLLLMTMSFALVNFVITLIVYCKRYKAEHLTLPWMTLLLGLEIAICLFPVGGMWMYHTRLIMVNLTTNEHINVRKYKYLFPSVNGHRRYRNPWFKGWVGNMLDRMQPSDACYLIPIEHEPLQSNDENV